MMEEEGSFCFCLFLFFQAALFTTPPVPKCTKSPKKSEERNNFNERENEQLMIGPQVDVRALK
jgi:hypothetical protein